MCLISWECSCVSNLCVHIIVYFVFYQHMVMPSCKHGFIQVFVAPPEWPVLANYLQQEVINGTWLYSLPVGCCCASW